MISLSLRVDIDPHGRIGPGKIKLLEQIGALGSISAAGRSMSMSYKRAWALVDELNRCFGRSEEHTSELQSLMRISYDVFCLKKKNRQSTRSSKSASERIKRNKT